MVSPGSPSQLAVVWFQSVAVPPTCPAINLPPPLDECVAAPGMFQLQNSLCRSFPSSTTDKYAFDIFIKKERKHIGKYVSFLPAQTKAPEVEEDGGLLRGKRRWGAGAVLRSTFEIPEWGQVGEALSQTTGALSSLQGCPPPSPDDGPASVRLTSNKPVSQPPSDEAHTL